MYRKRSRDLRSTGDLRMRSVHTAAMFTVLLGHTIYHWYVWVVKNELDIRYKLSPTFVLYLTADLLAPV